MSHSQPPAVAGPDASPSPEELRQRQHFTLLFRMYYAPMKQLATLLLGDEDLGKDAASDVFRDCWEKRDRFIAHLTRERESVRVYLMKCLINDVRDTRRKEEARRRLHEKAAALAAESRRTETTGERNAQAGDLDGIYRLCVSELPPRMREAWALVRGQGLQHAEAGRAMGTTASTVTNHVWHASERLYAAMAARGVDLNGYDPHGRREGRS